LSGYRDAHPGRISDVWNVETPLGSGLPSGGLVSRPRGRPNSPAGKDDPEANAGGRKAAGSRDEGADLQRHVSHNWPDTGVCPPRKGADGVR
jgi:hypothetical protein